MTEPKTRGCRHDSVTTGDPENANSDKTSSPGQRSEKRFHARIQDSARRFVWHFPERLRLVKQNNEKILIRMKNAVKPVEQGGSRPCRVASVEELWRASRREPDVLSQLHVGLTARHSPTSA